MVIDIPGEPHGQGRGRAVAFQDRSGRTRARVYDPQNSREWKAVAQHHMRLALDGTPPLQGPVRLQVFAMFTCPRSHWRKRTPTPRRWHVQKPDHDNIIKAISDSAKGVLWIDDCQVAEARITKVIGAQGEAPRVRIVVEPLAEIREPTEIRRTA